MSAFLREETQRLLAIDRPIDVIHNFFAPRPPRRSREEVRRELGVKDEAIILHCSNLRPVKRIDLLLETVARLEARAAFKLVILAGESFAPFDTPRQTFGDRGPSRRPRKGGRHRGLSASRGFGLVHFGDGKLLPEHPGRHVLWLSQRRHARRRHSGSRRPQYDWLARSIRQCRCAGQRGPKLASRSGTP